jgi:AcrR family transcriptional regulator
MASKSKPLPAAKLDHRRAEVKAGSKQQGSSRELLLEAAARVFGRQGYRGASIDQIAAEAGFSKGALYWNFASKEDLFFALLDQTDERLRALLAMVAAAPSERDVSADLSRGMTTVLDEQRDLVLLFHEYSALAVRDPELASRYAKRNAGLRSEMATVIANRQKARGVTMAVPAEHIATAVIALIDGISIQRLTEPEVVPGELFGQILALIEDGLAAQAGASA